MRDLFYYTPGMSSSVYYHDLRPLHDDKTVLDNPHKGWYLHYVDNGMRFPRYRNTLREGDDLKWMPGLNHMYLRLDWSDIEEEEGVYRWDKVDEIIDKWSRLGYTFSLRLCTFELNRPMIPYSTPKWVFDKGAVFYEYRGLVRSYMSLSGRDDEEYVSFEPDYSDPIYIDCLERFMEEYGRHFNGNPLIDFIDIGTFGQFGEGNFTAMPEGGKGYSTETIRRHVDLHLKNFPDTYILINDDMLKTVGRYNPGDRQAFADYCAASGIGIRDDSLYVTYYRDHHGDDMLAIPTAFDMFWKHCPVDLECAHYVFMKDEIASDYGMRYVEALRRTHATYAGFHGDPYEWYGSNKSLHDHIANWLGYWYFPEGYELCDITRGCNTHLRLWISNRGFAPAYHDYETTISVIDNEGKRFKINLDRPDCRRWMCGETSEERICLETRHLKKGTYKLCLGIFSGERAIKLGLNSDCRLETGDYTIGELNII